MGCLGLADVLADIIEDEDLAEDMEAPRLNPRLLTNIQGARICQMSLAGLWIQIRMDPSSLFIFLTGSGSRREKLKNKNRINARKWVIIVIFIK